MQVISSSGGVSPAVIVIGANLLGLAILGIYLASGRGENSKPMTFWRTVWAVIVALWIFSTLAGILYGLVSTVT